MQYVLLFTVIAHGHIKTHSYYGDAATKMFAYHSLALCEQDRARYAPAFRPKRGVRAVIECVPYGVSDYEDDADANKGD